MAAEQVLRVAGLAGRVPCEASATGDGWQKSAVRSFSQAERLLARGRCVQAERLLRILPRTKQYIEGYGYQYVHGKQEL